MVVEVMTVVPTTKIMAVDAVKIRRFLTQIILVVLINVPSISFGLAMGWVSFESGEGAEGEEAGIALVGAAAATFLAGALAMPLAARAIAAGRKPAMLATSGAFIICWTLKLFGGFGIVIGRAAAGLGGTAAWVIPPMLANEMCCSSVRGAAAVALVLAHNVGFLLMYIASDAQLADRTVLLCCLGLSVAHFIVYIFVPESPAYLAANGKYKEARASLAWCRGFPADTTSSELDVELKALPEPDLEPVSPFKLAKDMLSDVRRRKAFIIALVAVVGQEMCGLMTLLQFAERVFYLAAGENGDMGVGKSEGRKAASDAVVLGAVQLVASALALYLVEKIGRRPLLVWGAIVSGLCLAGGAAAVAVGSRIGALAALATAVFADSAGMQPAPYALLAEMFTYQYRGCASLLVTAASDLANAIEIVIFPAIVHNAGLATALAVAATLTLAMATFAFFTVPETMDRTPEEIYEVISPGIADPTNVKVEKSDIDNISGVEVDVNEDKSGNNNVTLEEVEERDNDRVGVNEIVLIVNDERYRGKSNIVESQEIETVDKNIKEMINSDDKTSLAIEVSDVNKDCDKTKDLSDNDNKSLQHVDNESIVNINSQRSSTSSETTAPNNVKRNTETDNIKM